MGEINLSSNVLETEEKLGEKLYQNMVSENRENYEYGPTMPPIEEALPKIDFFGLGFQPKNSENCKGKISKQKKNQSLFRVSNKIYDDDEIEEYEIEVKNNKNENLEKNTPQFSELSTEVPGFVLGLTVESEIKFSPPTIPLNYNPRTYFLQMKSKNYEKTKKTEKKYEKNTDKTEKNQKNDPLFSGFLSVSEIERIKKLKKFVKSSDSLEKQRIISKESLPYTSDPIKNLRCYNFFCTMEGLEIGGISEAHLMTASSLQQEKQEFLELYEN